MQVAFVIAANKHTGAAAAAELCCRSLHVAGHSASLLYVRGNNLQDRLEGAGWAQPGLAKERGPGQVLGNLSALRRAALEAEVVVSHLPHDQLLCLVAGAHRRSVLVRAYRSSRHLGGDPYTRLLMRGVKGELVAHSELQESASRRPGTVPSLAIPVPLEDRFSPGADGRLWRGRLAIPEHARVVGAIGKLSRGRGFELLIDSVAHMATPAHVLVIGHGEAQHELQERAERLGIGQRMHWAGYQERALPGLYAAMDVMLFLAAGSDHGHRAISEAQGCGRPVVAVDVPGVRDLIEHGFSGLVVKAEADAVAGAAGRLLSHDGEAERLGRGGADAVESRRFGPSGRRLGGFLERVAARPRTGASGG